MKFENGFYSNYYWREENEEDIDLEDEYPMEKLKKVKKIVINYF